MTRSNRQSVAAPVLTLAVWGAAFLWMVLRLG